MRKGIDDISNAKRFYDLRIGDTVLSYTSEKVELHRVTGIQPRWIYIEYPDEDMVIYVDAAKGAWTTTDSGIIIWADPEYGIGNLWETIKYNFDTGNLTTIRCLEWIQRLNEITEEYEKRRKL